MKPPRFDYAAPRTLGEAVSLLQQHEGEAKLLSGGQSLVPLLNMRLARPAILVDLAKVDGLDHVRERAAHRALVPVLGMGDVHHRRVQHRVTGLHHR